MAPGFTPVIQCFLVVAAAVSCASGNEFYFLEISSDGPITSGAQATVNATLLITNNSRTLVADPRLYDFHWIYSPLLLTHYSENESSSAITVRGKIPGSYTVSVWLTERHCSSCEPIARNTTELQVTKTIVGYLTATQEEANGTSFRNGFFLATNSKVKLSFLIHDPSNFFKSAEFTYKWSFGDGTIMVTSEPFVYHNYSTPGNVKTSLQVSAHLHDSKYEKHSQKKTGSFTAIFTLQDVISNITVAGHTHTTTSQNFSVSLHIFGSPPLTVCWLIKSDCVSLDGEECRPVVTSHTTYIIKHTFKSAGHYCLSAKAHNEVSELLNHHSITVDSAGLHPVWFVLPCCSFIAIAICFIFFTLFRAGSNSAHQKSLVEVADFDFSPVTEKYQALPDYKEIPAGILCCTYCTTDSNPGGEQRAETQPLLHTLSAPIRSYTL
ncbi:transmembrane protein 130 [Mixophyes fleayi]|uniref:transmembrane protein 130 n=1 Tax=Mixophyes fleayi TaxID=3061075 RepID=UPI003F4DB2E9